MRRQDVADALSIGDGLTARSAPGRGGDASGGGEPTPGAAQTRQIAQPDARDRGSTRLAVVTGASSGIGAALARRLARDEWRCVLVARREERLRELAQELGAEYEVCDVTRREQVDDVAARVLERHPRVNLLANNAGIPGRRDFLSAEPELVERVLATNYLGGLWSLRAFLPGLEAAAPEAHVVNVVSVAGTVAFPPSGPYSASKHAQLAFSRATAAQLSRRGIHVLTVLPGFIETEGFPQRNALQSKFFRGRVKTPEELVERIVDALPRRRRELTYPSFYRVFGIAQALAPSLVGRFAARSRGGYKKPA